VSFIYKQKRKDLKAGAVPACLVSFIYKQKRKDLKAEALLNERLRSVATHLVTFRLSLVSFILQTKRKDLKAEALLNTLCPLFYKQKGRI
jgi:hypothetical protein